MRPAPTTSPSTPTSPSTARTSRASSPAPTARSREPGLGLPIVRGLSGVAPGAWLGNYRGLARGDHESGAIGSTVELAAAVDSAVADGMDVLNLSLGGPQIDPSADALALALANAARAGVPSVVAAGNDFDSRGYGSISSPGTSARRRSRSRRRRARASSASAAASAASDAPGARAVHRGAVDRAARDPSRSARPTRARRRGGLRPRPPRLPRAGAPPRAARGRDRAARRLQLRHEGDQRARGRGAGRDRRRATARARRSSSRRRPTCRCSSSPTSVGEALRAYVARAGLRRARCASRARSPSCRRRRAC